MKPASTSYATLLALFAKVAFAQEWADSTVHEIVLQTTLATDLEPDHWECVIANLTQYFDPPRPTGALLDALDDYANDIIDTCTKTAGDETTDACWPSKEQWCGLTTAIPKSLAPDISSWGEAASSWWSAHSSAAVSLAEECPIGWYDAMYGVAGGDTWLNMTIIYAACHAEAHGTADAGAVKPSSTTAKPDSIPTEGMVGATHIPEVNGAARARGGIWI
ncbi:hypothetical protein HJFPF1_10281 [Paramyrothecium foliicola]|nr:hypothetical protein HJFPF1_10281 [Paramyrothecium foliicola]